MLHFPRLKTPLFVAVLSGIYLLSTGCTIRGLTSGYKKLSKEEKATVRIVDAAHLDMFDPNGIYRISASELQSFLRIQPKSLVYVWVPRCNSAQCLALKTYASYAQQNNLKLFVVADSYEMELFEINRLPEEPIFVIDHKQYGSNIRGTYSKRFIQDLTGNTNLPDSVLYAQLFFFNRDSLVRTVEKSRDVVLP